jgi:hypothetical protein
MKTISYSNMSQRNVAAYRDLVVSDRVADVIEKECETHRAAMTDTWILVDVLSWDKAIEIINGIIRGDDSRFYGFDVYQQKATEIRIKD